MGDKRLSDTMRLSKGQVATENPEAIRNRKGWYRTKCQQRLHSTTGRYADRVFYLDCTANHFIFSLCGVICHNCKIENNWRNRHKDCISHGFSAFHIAKFHMEEYLREQDAIWGSEYVRNKRGSEE